MARKKRRRRSSGFTLPIAPIAGLAAGMGPAIDQLMRGQPVEALNQISANYLGYYPPTNEFKPEWMLKGTVPLVLGLLVHKFVGGPPLNFNRMLGRARVPFIRI